MSNQEAEFYSRSMEKYRDKCEALEAKNGELENQLKLSNEFVEIWRDKAIELEKKLEIAVEALEYVDGYWHNPHIYDDSVAEMKMTKALAAINGEGV